MIKISNLQSIVDSVCHQSVEGVVTGFGRLFLYGVEFNIVVDARIYSVVILHCYIPVEDILGKSRVQQIITIPVCNIEFNI